jgi:hypothetical protein
MEMPAGLSTALRRGTLEFCVLALLETVSSTAWSWHDGWAASER